MNAFYFVTISFVILIGIISRNSRMHRLESALNLIEKKLGMDELMPIQYFFVLFYLKAAVCI